MAADLNFAVFVFIPWGYGENKTAKVFTLKIALKGTSLLYIFFKNLCNNTEFSFRVYAFVAKHEDLPFYRRSCRRRLVYGQISG